MASSTPGATVMTPVLWKRWEIWVICHSFIRLVDSSLIRWFVNQTDLFKSDVVRDMWNMWETEFCLCWLPVSLLKQQLVTCQPSSKQHGNCVSTWKQSFHLLGAVFHLGFGKPSHFQSLDTLCSARQLLQLQNLQVQKCQTIPLFTWCWWENVPGHQLRCESWPDRWGPHPSQRPTAGRNKKCSIIYLQTYSRLLKCHVQPVIKGWCIPGSQLLQVLCQWTGSHCRKH